MPEKAVEEEVRLEKQAPPREKFEIPFGVDTTFKAYMDYKYITDKTSNQYKLQELAYTNGDGLRMIGDYYCVALGTYYSNFCGDKFLITLDDGTSFKAVAADIKDKKHTNVTGMFTPLRAEQKNIYNDAGLQMVNVVEFIVDAEKLPDSVRYTFGSVSKLGFEGNVTAIEQID